MSSLPSAPPERQRGVTLVELMIALVLGLLITAGIYQLFSASQRTHRLEQAVASVQENGRFLLNVFQRELRHAGFPPACQGEAGAEGSLIINMSSSLKKDLFPNDRFDSVMGWQDRSSSDGYTQRISPGDYQAGNILLIHHAADPANIALSASIVAGKRDVAVAGGENLSSGDLLAFVFQNRCEVAETTEDGRFRAPQGFSFSFPQDATWIGEPVGDLYYVGWDSPRQEPALRRLDLVSGKSETLVSPVVDMQLRYLVDGQYQSTPGASRWDDVAAVRISLLVRSSAGRVLESPAHVQVGDIDFTAPPGDLRLYRGFTSTVALRNRLVGER
ncbi:PilW family protein [Modicisalibacter sp. 'Wilcox']|uniref:PilW family protein n=1 Tax=Modicisalibacter sp. 'Wilcox' TaxID=2679914 RepID=UPI0013D7E805|nr:PilW family protein [Modicisalibacter sp. 'Wilcox']